MSDDLKESVRAGGSSKHLNRDISSTFVKGLSVLRVFDDSHTRMTLAEISNLAELDSASVRRLVLTLVHLGYVEKDGRHFSLSPKILVFAGSFLRGNQFGTHIQPLLNRYAAILGASVSLAIRDGDRAVYVAQSTIPDENVTFGFTVGSRLPLAHSAIGRMILAYDDPKLTSTYIADASFERYTPVTEMDRETLVQKIQTCRTQGYAIVEGEFEAGVTGFSVPVGGVESLKAVVGTLKPEISVKSPEKRMEIVSLLQQLASELSRTRIFGEKPL